MSKITKKTKTTFRLDSEIFSTFSDHIKELGLRRDAFLNRVLGTEVDYLSKLSANSPAVESLLRLMREAHKPDLSKVGITLDQDLLTEINKVCEEKRIPRDLFLEHFLNYLVHGPASLGEGDGPAPLPTAAALIYDPREQFISWNNSAKPYDALHISDDSLKEVLRETMNE